MKKAFAACLILALSTLSGKEENGLRRIQAHLLIEDCQAALNEASTLAKLYPQSRNVKSALIRALAANGFQERALKEWHLLADQYPDLIQDRALLEQLAWKVLAKGTQSTQYSVRLSALIGAYLTRDIQALPILLEMMQDSNAVIRSVAVQMVVDFGDAPLKDAVSRLLTEEKVWLVRLEVIRAIGALRIKECVGALQQIVSSDRNTFEERSLAIEALLQIYKEESLKEIGGLVRSNRAGMRHLACIAATHFRMKDAKEEILFLIKDSNPDVRIAALNALGVFYRNDLSVGQAKEHLLGALEDESPPVAITAAWAACIVDPAFGIPYLNRWIESDVSEFRHLAAAALMATGDRGISLARQMLEKSPDPYVRANLAIGLISQRDQVKKCSDILYSFFTEEKTRWMVENRSNPLFQVLAPSRIRHIDQIPNYPEAINQLTRLHLISILAIVEDPRAEDMVKNFLKSGRWGITGVAAATLLQEGDENSLELVRGLVGDSDVKVRLQANLALAMLGRDEAVAKDLERAYEEADHETKLHILEALGRIGSSSSLPFFLKVLAEPFPVLQMAAATGLIQGLNR